MHLLAYAPVLLLPAVAAVGLALGGAWAWALPILIFVAVPAAELLLPGDPSNYSPEQEQARRDSAAFDWLLYAVVPIQVALVIALAATAGAMTPAALLGSVLSVGISCGGLGINVAHELGHRPSRRARSAAKVLLLTSLYQHFYIEHNRGHHARVATPDDPASAREGEGLYGFWWRSVTAGWRSAWELEAHRLRRRGQSVWGWQNEMVRFTAAQLGAVAALGLAFGPAGALAFVAAAVIGFLLLETVNYVEHYGLTRDQRPDGRYERVRPAHSWTSNRPVGRVLLFDLTRHADHHANPTRPYQILRHFDDAPELPTGYPGMILLALVPPAFRAVMDRQVATERARLAA